MMKKILKYISEYIKTHNLNLKNEHILILHIDSNELNGAYYIKDEITKEYKLNNIYKKISSYNIQDSFLYNKDSSIKDITNTIAIIEKFLQTIEINEETYIKNIILGSSTIMIHKKSHLLNKEAAKIYVKDEVYNLLNKSVIEYMNSSNYVPISYSFDSIIIDNLPYNGLDDITAKNINVSTSVYYLQKEHILNFQQIFSYLNITLLDIVYIPNAINNFCKHI